MEDDHLVFRRVTGERSYAEGLDCSSKIVKPPCGVFPVLRQLYGKRIFLQINAASSSDPASNIAHSHLTLHHHPTSDKASPDDYEELLWGQPLQQVKVMLGCGREVRKGRNGYSRKNDAATSGERSEQWSEL